MGSSSWSADHYTSRTTARAAAGVKAFAYDDAIKTNKVAAAVHPSLDPKGVNLRESRDSDAHPESHAVAILLDVTGSMAEVPMIIQANLPKLMGLLIRKGYLAHPQIMIGAIGDAYSDKAPLQVGQFESGIEIDNDLTNLFLEGNGGGQNRESYDLAMYFLARHTAMDCFEKRGKKGYCFIIGDEKSYEKVRPDQVQSLIGDKLETSLTNREILVELEKTFDVYFVIPRMTSHWDSPEIHKHWKELVGQNFLKLDDPAAICELIASTIAMGEGLLDSDTLISDLMADGSSELAAHSVSRALATVADATAGKRGVAVNIPDSGAASGLARL